MFLGVTLLSVIIIIAIFVTIANVGLPPPFLTAVIIAGCGAAFGIIALLIQFLLRLTGLSRPAAIQYGPGFTGKEPEAITPGALRQIPQPQAFGSVTENTTRSFPAPERTQREQ
jgi:hypothetical protein